MSLCWASKASGRSWENSNQIISLEYAKRFYQLNQSFGSTVQRLPNSTHCAVKGSLDRGIFPCPFPVCSEMSVEDANCAVLRITACLCFHRYYIWTKQLWLHKGNGFQITMRKHTRSRSLLLCISVHRWEWEGQGNNPLQRMGGKTPSRTYLLSNYVVPVVVQNGFHFQAICKGGIIQTVVQADVDWR